MKKVFGMLMIFFSFLTCTDNPPSTATIKMPDDRTVKSAGSVAFLIKAIVYDSETKARYNGFEVEFICGNCVFLSGAGYEETTDNLVGEFNETRLVKKTDKEGVASVWVGVASGTEATVFASLENGISDDTKLTVSAP